MTKRLPWRCRNQQQARDKAAIYNSREWRELRALKLRTQPLCERCLELGRKAGGPGWVRAAHCVHHIIPIESATTLEEMRRLALHCGLDGLMSLCDQCHAEIHREAGSHTKAAVKQRETERHDRRRAWLIERFTGHPFTATDTNGDQSDPTAATSPPTPKC